MTGSGRSITPISQEREVIGRYHLSRDLSIGAMRASGLIPAAGSLPANKQTSSFLTEILEAWDLLSVLEVVDAEVEKADAAINQAAAVLGMDVKLPAGAQKALRHALETDPLDFDACLHLGAMLRREGDTNGAELYLRHALVIRPNSAAAQYQIGALEATTGHPDEARISLEMLIKQWPEFQEAHVQLAMIYARLHRTEDSLREQKIIQDLMDKARIKGPQPDTVE